MEPLLLLRGVREVSELANPEWPLETTQRAFDEVRSQSQRFVSVPPAKRIAETLKLPWRVIVEVAHEPEGNQGSILKRKHPPEQENWLTEDYVSYALKLVARRLNVITLSSGQYRVERDKLLGEDQKHWLHGRLLWLPNEDQIMRIAGSWENALLLAGLKINPRPARAIRQVILTRVEAIERFYEHYEAQPTYDNLVAFTRANKIPCSDEGKRPWPESVADWKQRRHEKGLPVPAAPPPSKERADYSQDVGAARPGEYLHKGKWANPEACLKWVRLYLQDLKPGVSASQRGYADWVRKHPGAPSLSRVTHHGTWLTILSQAREASGQSKQPD
jgi:hypothetical protein